MANNFIMTSANNLWSLSYGVDHSGSQAVTLNTAGTFVDKNIYIQIDTPAGAYSSTAAVTTAGTITPSVAINNASTYGFVTTKPSGTNGTNYLTLDPGATVTTKWKATPTATISTAGYIPTGSKAGTAVEGTPTIAAGTNYYVPIITPTFGGGQISYTTNLAQTNPTITISASGTFKTASGYGVTTTQPTGTDGTQYLSIDATGTSTDGTMDYTVTPTITDVTYTNAAGVMAAHPANNPGTVSITPIGTSHHEIVETDITDNFPPYYIPIVSASFGGGALTTNTNTNTVGTTPVVTVNGSGSFLTATDYGVTDTQPSGTDGEQYLTVDASGSVTTTGQATSSWKVTRGNVTYTNAAGAIAAHNAATATLSASSTATGTKAVNITPSITDNFSPKYIPIVSPTFSGGGLSGSTTTTITPSSTIATTGSTTDYYIDAAATGTITRAAITYTNAAGAIAAHSGASVLTAGSRSAASTATRVYIPAATATVTASKAATVPTIENVAGQGISGKTQITAAPSTSGSSINQYYMVVKANAGATTLDITKSVTGGYLSANTQITASAATTATSSGNYYIPITSGIAAAGTGTASVSLYTTDGSASGYNVSASVNTLSDSEPTSGPYVAVSYSGSGFSKVTTAGWFPTGNLTTSSAASGTKYIPLKEATVTPSYANSNMGTYFTTGSSSDYSVSITPNYSANQKGFLNTTSKNGTVGYWKIKTTSIQQGTTVVDGTSVTRGTATWDTGWITSGTMAAATFANSATSGVIYKDISDTTAAPVLASGGDLYINKGYTDNLKISLAKLIPDFDTTTYNVATTNQMLNGYVAYDQDGGILTGSIQSKDAATYNTSTSNQTIAAGQYLAGAQTIRAVTTSNIDAANIKYNVNVKVGDSASAGRIKNVTGTFTSSTTVSDGQVAATAADMLQGTSAWVNGVEVKGNIQTITPAFDGGGLTVGSTLSQSNVTLSTTNTSGISVSSTGNATRAAVLYNGAAKGFIDKADNTQALAAISTAVNQSTPTTRYITNVVLPMDKTLSVTTSADTALDTTSDLDITNNAYRRVDIINNAYGNVIVNNAGTSTVTSNAANAGTLKVNAYDTTTLSGEKTIVENGKWKTATATASGTYYGKVTIGAATLGSEGSVTTAPSVTVNNSTTMATTNTATSYSFTVSGTANNGTVQTKYKATAAGYTPVVNATNGGTVTVTPGVTGGTTVYIPAAVGSVTMTAGSGSCTYNSGTNITVADNDTDYNSGVSVKFNGSGSVSATAKITTAGYTPTNNNFATGSSTASNSASLTKYIKGVTLTAPSSGTRQFDITVPNGTDDTITFHFHVDSESNVYID